MQNLKEIIRQLEQLRDDVERIKTDIDRSPLRVEPSSLVTSSDIRWAVIIEAPPNNRRWAWANIIDTNGSEITGGEGSRIQVYFEVYGQVATMLDKCVPRLYFGSAGIGDSAVVPIVQRAYNEGGSIETRWYCIYPMNESKECICEPLTA